MGRESEQEVEYKVEFWQNLEKKHNTDHDFPPQFAKYGVGKKQLMMLSQVKILPTYPSMQFRHPAAVQTSVLVFRPLSAHH